MFNISQILRTFLIFIIFIKGYYSTGVDDAGGIEQNGPENKSNEKYLQVVNDYRKLHGSPPLSFDILLGQHAEKWAKKVQNKLRNAHFVALYSHPHVEGENVFVTPGNVSCITAIDKWYSEMVNYNFTAHRFTFKTAQFTQLVWKSTNKIGVAVIFDKDRNFTVVVARFVPPGNVGFESSFKENVLPDKNYTPRKSTPIYAPANASSIKNRTMKTSSLDNTSIMKLNQTSVTEKTNNSAVKQNYKPKMILKENDTSISKGNLSNPRPQKPLYNKIKDDKIVKILIPRGNATPWNETETEDDDLDLSATESISNSVEDDSEELATTLRSVVKTAENKESLPLLVATTETNEIYDISTTTTTSVEAMSPVPVAGGRRDIIIPKHINGTQLKSVL